MSKVFVCIHCNFELFEYEILPQRRKKWTLEVYTTASVHECEPPHRPQTGYRKSHIVKGYTACTTCVWIPYGPREAAHAYLAPVSLTLVVRECPVSEKKRPNLNVFIEATGKRWRIWSGYFQIFRLRDCGTKKKRLWHMGEGREVA